MGTLATLLTELLEESRGQRDAAERERKNQLEGTARAAIGSCLTNPTLKNELGNALRVEAVTLGGAEQTGAVAFQLDHEELEVLWVNCTAELRDGHIEWGIRLAASPGDVMGDGILLTNDASALYEWLLARTEGKGTG